MFANGGSKGQKRKKYAHLLSTQHRQLSNVRHNSTLCRTHQIGAAAEQLRRRQFSGLVAMPVLLQMALHTAVRLALIAERTLFGHEHRLDRNEGRLLAQDRSQVQLVGAYLAIEPVVSALRVVVGAD